MLDVDNGCEIIRFMVVRVTRVYSITNAHFVCWMCSKNIFLYLLEVIKVKFENLVYQCESQTFQIILIYF